MEYSYLKPYEFFKYDRRPETFIKKILSRDTFETVRGPTILAIDNSLILAIKNRDSNTLLQMSILDIYGNKYKFRDFLKTSEFGGKGIGFSDISEVCEVQSINEKMQNIMKDTGKSYIDLFVGNELYRVSEAKLHNFNLSKCDISLVNDLGEHVVWISHKKGKGADKIAQWSGLSPRVHWIYERDETQEFIESVFNNAKKSFGPGSCFARRIESYDLKICSAFGNNFRKSVFDENNVTCIVQGNTHIIPHNDVYKLASTSAFFVNPCIITGEYEPEFMAVYKGDRNQFGIKGARFGIFPKGHRKNKVYI